MGRGEFIESGILGVKWGKFLKKEVWIIMLNVIYKVWKMRV